MNFYDEFIEDNLPPGASGDTTPPTITILSPTPGVAPGSPGGFPADWSIARTTPIVLRITDVTPGNRYQCVVVRYANSADEQTVYRRGAFRGAFAALSFETPNGSGKDLTVLPVGGWPSSDAINDVTFEIDALDAAGNLAS